MKDGNELPNPGFEYCDTSIEPWEGTGALSVSARRSGQNGLLLQSGQSIEQYVYLNNTSSYKLRYWHKGNSTLKVIIDNMTPVTGELDKITAATQEGNNSFKENELNFKTGTDYKGNLKTIRVAFINTGNTAISLDDITIRKADKE